MSGKILKLNFSFFTEKFRNLTCQHIWDHLDKFFDLEKADVIEKSFFNFEDNQKEMEFFLPVREFADAMAEMNTGKNKTNFRPVSRLL